MFGSGINTAAYPLYKQAGFLAALKKINFGTILTNTQKTLNVVNQAIPIVYQIKPMVNNAKTMFKIVGAVKSDGKSVNNRMRNNINNNIEKNTKNNIENYARDNVSKETHNYQNTSLNTPNFFI